MKLGLFTALTTLASAVLAQQSMHDAARELKDSINNGIEITLSTARAKDGAPVGIPISFTSYAQCKMPSKGEPIVLLADNSHFVRDFNANGKVTATVQQRVFFQTIPERTSKAVFFGTLEKIENQDELRLCIENTWFYNRFLTPKGKGTPSQYYKVVYDSIFYSGLDNDPNAYVGWIDLDYYQSLF